MAKRIIQMWWDVDHGFLRDSTGAALRVAQYPFLFYQEEAIINLLLVTDGDLTAYTGLGSSGETYKAAIDSEYDRSTTPMVLTADADINKAGDWGAAGGTADPAQGQFSIRVDGDTTSFQSKIGTKAELNVFFELQAFDGSTVIAVFDTPFVAKGLLYGAGTPENVALYVPGTVSIPLGVDYVTVSGLGLSSVPDQILVSVRKDTGGDFNLWATVRENSVTTDGFIADLSGQTDSADYELDYLVIRT